MKRFYNRRDFLKTTSITSMGISAGLTWERNFSASQKPVLPSGKRVGIIGLDTSHSVAFTKALNNHGISGDYRGYNVVAAYPGGSNDIESSVSRVPGFTKEVESANVEIVASIDELLSKVDVVLLESNDGRLHLEQALQVMKAGKRVFIDKPIAASLTDVVAIFDAAKEFSIPFFSSSSLRYTKEAQAIRSGKAIGNVLGADTFSPAPIERSHPDLYWYGIHGVEALFTVMGEGCREVRRVFTAGTDIVVGTWKDGRLGTFRGTRKGKHQFGGTAFGENGVSNLGGYAGYHDLLKKIIDYFETGVPPINESETLEIYAFMDAADESKMRNGALVRLEEVLQKTK